jgi:hypothetical protein
MAPPRRSRGLTLLLAVLALAAAFAAVALVSALAPAASRDAVSDRALAQAREALVAYAADRNITPWVGPGYLPCPDLDDDGWAEPTCGSQGGDSGQEQRLGRLPWKTLGIPDLRDGYGERLWYAVSSKHKGLLNCAQSRACLDMTPDSALGTITVRDASGTVVPDGTSTDLYAVDRTGAAAVIIAPGPPLRRLGAAAEQQRGCTSKCDPADFLDKAPEGARAGEDNSGFVDRNDASGRARNTDGFIQGPVFAADGRVLVNDRLSVIAYRDLMPRVMRRVALEVAQCLRFYASRPENGGRYPRPAPACRQAIADPAIAWADSRDALFGRVPDTPFAATREESGGRMLERWWGECRIALEPPDEGRTAGLAENAWWTFWKPFVFYALAPDFAPGGTASAAGRQFAVIVAGAPLRLAEMAQRHGAYPGDARHWLEGVHAGLEGANPNPAAPECPRDDSHVACNPGDCLRVSIAPAGPDFNDVVAAAP